MIQLSDHFDYRKLFRFTLPSIMMMIFTSIYGVVDGFFVSNFVGKTPFAAVNFIMPFLMILGGFGFMFGTGGSALIAKTMGEGDLSRARRQFSLFVYTTIISGVVLSVLGILLLRPVAAALGAEGEMLEYCVRYGRIILVAIPAFMLQYEFQSFFVTAEKPKLGLWVTVAAGVTNMLLDALFVAVFQWGVEGAAAATALSQIVGGVLPLLYFGFRRSGSLWLTKTSFDSKALIRASLNGSSELMSNISMSIVSMLYNVQLMRYAGEDGVAAYGVLMYVSMIFIAAFLGYSVGMAPIVSFHFGAQNHAELKSLLRKSFMIIGSFSVIMCLAAEVLAYPLSVFFVGYDEALLALTLEGFKIYSFSFLFAGVAIISSAFFTALNNGFVSAAISFLRTCLFQIASVLLLPLILGINGIWLSIVTAEMLAFVVALLFLAGNKKRYRY